MSGVTQIVIGGLLQGGVFAIVALGFSLVYRVANVVNLSQPNNVVSSQSFNQSLSVAGGFFNRNETSLRTIDLQMSFSF